MSRKRKSDQSSSEDINTDTPAADTAVADAPAEGSHASEPKADVPTFAEKVGKRTFVPAPDPFGIAKDNLAKVRLFESKQDSQMAIKFGDGGPDDKPSQAVIDKMHEAGWKWNRADRIWAFPVMPHSAMSTRIDAEKLFQEVRQMIRQEKGLDAAAPDIAF